MGFRVASNVQSIFAQNQARNLNTELTDSVEKLASGQRITRSAHDPSGLAISEKMKSHIRSGRQAIRNSNDGVSFVQVAEGNLTEMGNFAARLRELAIQAATDTMGDEQRRLVDMEFQGLKTEIKRMTQDARWNDTRFFDGENQKIDFQIGIHGDPNASRFTLDKRNLNLTLEGTGIAGSNVLSNIDARNSIDSMTKFIEKVNDKRTTLGAYQNRLQTAISVLETGDINNSASNSRIRDLDMASGSSDNVAMKIREQATTAVMAQASNQYQGVLKLVG